MQIQLLKWEKMKMTQTGYKMTHVEWWQNCENAQGDIFIVNKYMQSNSLNYVKVWWMNSSELLFLREGEEGNVIDKLTDGLQDVSVACYVLFYLKIFKLRIEEWWDFSFFWPTS